MKGLQCSFCNTSINHLTRKDIENNWGKALGNIDGKTISIIHCPKHEEEYKHKLDGLFLNCKKATMRYKIKSQLQETLKLSDIPHLLLWRKLLCAIIGHNLEYYNPNDGNAESCIRCGMARTSFIVEIEADNIARHK